MTSRPVYQAGHKRYGIDSCEPQKEAVREGKIEFHALTKGHYPGTMMPMVARDGLHYGASIAMPRAGHYTLTYRIDPPSAGGLGRHADPATGVAPWWEPFEVSFDWDYPGPP